MSKKVIEQEDSGRPNIVIQRNQNNGSYLLKSRGDDGIVDMIVILSENSTTVAKAIDPEYQKVIDENISLRKENIDGFKLAQKRISKLKDRNAKLVVALEGLIEGADNFCKSIPASFTPEAIYLWTKRVEAIEALQNTKNIEG